MPTRAPDAVSIVLVAIVVPWRTSASSPGSARRAIPSTTASEGSCGVVGSFSTVRVPVPRSASTTSVNVPPDVDADDLHTCSFAGIARTIPPRSRLSRTFALEARGPRSTASRRPGPLRRIGARQRTRVGRLSDEEGHPRRHDRDGDGHGAGRRADRRRDRCRHRVVRGRGRRADRRDRLLRPAWPDRQPHAPVDAVRRHVDERRLRHRHAGGRGGRRHLPRRLRAADAPGRPALLAGGVAGPRRGRRARRLRLPHGDHEGRRRHLRRHAGDGRRGRLDVQGLPRLPRRADGHRRPLPGDAVPHEGDRRPGHGARRERRRHRLPGQEGAGAGQHRPDLPRADAPGGVRGRGDRARDPAGRVRGHADLHRPRLLQARRRRGHRRPRARRPGLRRDLHPVPVHHHRGPQAAGLRGRPLRLLAAAARGVEPGAHLERPRSTTTCSRSRPTTARSPTSRSGSATATSRRSRTASPHPAPPRAAVGARRARGPHVAEPAGRGDVDGDREDLRPAPAQGHHLAGRRRRHRHLRPQPPVHVLDRHVAHERRLRPVRGQDGGGLARGRRCRAARSSSTTAASSRSPATAAS